jgi:tetrahydromethanopterin S-methyltransferase subunit B
LLGFDGLVYVIDVSEISRSIKELEDIVDDNISV